MINEQELLLAIEEFREKHRMPETTFGMKALGDPNFIEDLRSQARSPKLRTVRRILHFIEHYPNVNKGSHL